ncbi:MAG: hypothetical protein MUC87_00455 [Bacteroidia bacterium]|jgi:hypothetical protein|nr:hypothetical protein [Bacteroidia bacterium]
MPINEATYEQLERWLRGDLNAAELAAFETRLAQEPELLEEAEWLTNAQEVMNDEGRASFKQMIAGIGAGVAASSLAQYTPTRNAIPKWKMWLKKFWWIPVGVVAAASAIAFALTAVEITREDHPPLIPNEMLNAPEGKTDSVKEEKPGQVPVIPEKDSVGQKPGVGSSSQGGSKPRIKSLPASGTSTHIVKESSSFSQSEELFGVDQKYFSLVNSLIFDSLYTDEQIIKSLKRRKIRFNSQPSSTDK